jgi:hypothetical protein
MRNVRGAQKREREWLTRLKAPLKTIKHMPDDEHIPEPA